ncbi:hypothetical protein B0H16DRAFT_1520653 [Mycena metata]|uniref:Uncharacterized protein n=1 Tax=Mycena metata TaxID=1033252 RepID=A0AAD7JM09_9AGAR|nr:hypothetical protein B0H16DRAFT_1520653 [Mycena metata]
MDEDDSDNFEDNLGSDNESTDLHSASASRIPASFPEPVRPRPKPRVVNPLLGKDKGKGKAPNPTDPDPTALSSSIATATTVVTTPATSTAVTPPVTSSTSTASAPAPPSTVIPSNPSSSIGPLRQPVPHTSIPESSVPSRPEPAPKPAKKGKPHRPGVPDTAWNLFGREHMQTHPKDTNDEVKVIWAKTDQTKYVERAKELQAEKNAAEKAAKAGADAAEGGKTS